MAQQNRIQPDSSKELVISDSLAIHKKNLDKLYKTKKYDSCIKDSRRLINKYQKRLEYTALPFFYNNLAKSLRRKSQYKNGLIAAKSSTYWAKKNNQQELLTFILTEVARNQKGLRDYDEAIESYNEALSYCEKYGDLDGKSIVLNNVGAIYKIKGEYTKAIQYYIKDAELNRELNRAKDLAIAYNNIGQIHLLTREYELALSFFKRSKDLRIQENDEYGIALVSNNIGAIYHELEQYDKALDQFYIALAAFEKFNSKYRIAEVNLNIADICILQKDAIGAVTFAQKGLGIFKEINHLPGINRGRRVLGEAFLLTNNYNNALVYLEKTLSFYDNEKHYTSDKKNVYLLLVKIYSEKLLFKKAFDCQKKLHEIEVESTKAANIKDLSKIHERYNNREQLMKIDRLQKEQEQKEEVIRYQKHVNFSFVLVIIMLSAFGIYIFFINKKLRKAHKYIRTQNREITEINTELTDSLKYASKIQQSLNSIPTEFKSYIFDHFILWHPSQEVSGDVYNISVVDNKIIITLMDCAGHGVPAALLATLGIKTLNQVIQSGVTSPDKILTEVDKTMSTIFDQHEDIVGIDMSVVTINLDKLILDFAGARRPLYYIDDSGSYYIKGTKRSVCDTLSSFHYSFHKHRIPLTSDLKFYLYSDGYPDQFGGDLNKKFLEKNLRNLLSKNSNLTFEDQKSNLEEKRNKWMNPEKNVHFKPTDDTLVMGFHIKI